MLYYNAVYGGAAEALRVTEYTAGAGTHTVLPSSTYQMVQLVAAGGTGGTHGINGATTYAGSGGNAGEELYRRAKLAPTVQYEVGAVGGPGGNTRLGFFVAKGGAKGNNNSGTASLSPPSVDFTPAYGLTPGGQAGQVSIRNGGDSAMGKGATTTTAATGYGGGGCGGANSSTPPTVGTGGYIRIEEY